MHSYTSQVNCNVVLHDDGLGYRMHAFITNFASALCFVPCNCFLLCISSSSDPPSSRGKELTALDKVTLNPGLKFGGKLEKKLVKINVSDISKHYMTHIALEEVHLLTQSVQKIDKINIGVKYYPKV